MRRVISRNKKCELCGKDFVDNSRFNTLELCSDFCKKEHSNYKRYSMPKEQYLELLKVPSCQLCPRKFKKRGDLHIDHCHSTGKVRGVLCRTCNISIGGLGDNIEGLRKALEYLEKAI